MEEQLGEEWFCELQFDITATRLLYDHVCYAIETWPGSPRRPPEEQEFLRNLKMSLFSSIMEYNLTEL